MVWLESRHSLLESLLLFEFFSNGILGNRFGLAPQKKICACDSSSSYLWPLLVTPTAYLWPLLVTAAAYLWPLLVTPAAYLWPQQLTCDLYLWPQQLTCDLYLWPQQLTCDTNSWLVTPTADLSYQLKPLNFLYLGLVLKRLMVFMFNFRRKHLFVLPLC